MIPLMKNAFSKEHETKEALAKFILRADRLSMDTECAAFEREFAEMEGVSEAVLFNSGGSSNLAMLQTLKNRGLLSDGDKVGFSALTWSTNVMPIIQLGLVPVPVDCSKRTLNIMSDGVEERIKEADLKVLFVTNALGFAGDMASIMDICDREGIILLEDNCEALGTELEEGKTGTFGLMSSFSFFVAHHMSTIEGGMVCTDDEECAEMLRIVRANGWTRNLNASQRQEWRRRHNVHSELNSAYIFYDLGYNLRPTEITGFLGRRQLAYLENNVIKRESNYRTLEEAVTKNPDLRSFDRSHIKRLSSFAFPILCKDGETREHYISKFAGAGIEIRPMIAGNIQTQPFYAKYVSETYSLPETEEVDRCGFYCGNYPELTDNDLEVISGALGKD